jgi:hypothetical protein
MSKPAPISAQARKLLRANPSVVGFSQTLKPKIVNGKPTGRLAIRVYVEKKLPPSKIPSGQALPKTIGKVPVDVEEIGKVEPANRQRRRPIDGGSSGIYTGGTAATLGYFVREKKAPPPPNKPQWYALSNAHALHPPAGTPNETIQPSPRDSGIAPQDWVGKESLYTYDKVDAAIARIDTGARAVIIGLPTPGGTAKVQTGMTVAKSGRTTGVTYGTVIDDDLEFKFPQWGTAPGRVRFERVFLIYNRHVDFGQGGDSGSLIIDPADQTAIGLLFGTSRRPGKRFLVTLASPIQLVMAAFPRQMLVLPGETYP